ncbi:oxidoreductase [uncultured Caulobacter sp.]|uniref:oxidoreductase n=1 Tax=uncultured Caulobacter sp. TaxID=158749 RepID=UPI0026306784|nr:oxidoreductase [uncultured Caulobacter sp.]
MTRTWFITGVSGGLGREIARAALARGDIVVGATRRPDAAAAFEAMGGHALIMDVTDTAAVNAAVARAEAVTGAIDVLVNNAGYGLVGAVEEASLDEVRAQFEVNVLGPLAVLKAALPAMRARRAGRIINITSVSGLAVWAGTGVYCASKWALEALTQTLAQEVAEFGIQVVNVAPGGLRTDFAQGSKAVVAQKLADYDGLARDAERIMAEHAGREPGDPAKAALAILAIADAEHPPMHLLLGEDALKYADHAAHGLAADIDAWRALSLSIGFND